MRPALIIVALALLWANATDADGPAPAEGPADRIVIVVQPEDCRALIEFYPSPDVAASAVDAYGRPVPPADLNPIFRPPQLLLFIEAPVIEKGTWRSEPRLMEITIDLETGEISSRGRPVPGLTSADLVKACARNQHD